MCGYNVKIGDVSPARNAKLKIIYGSRTSKTADTDTISIHIHMYYVYGWWLLKGGEGVASFQVGVHPPPPNENLTIK